jgi:hypothetical protein
VVNAVGQDEKHTTRRNAGSKTICHSPCAVRFIIVVVVIIIIIQQQPITRPIR